MCTALVVREDYWDRQLRIFAELRGVNLNQEQMQKIRVGLVGFADRVCECLRVLAEQLYQVCSEVYVCIKDTVSETIKALSDLFDECDIRLGDDFYTVCDKLENRMLYLNRKQYIRQEQYYKSQFKMAKINYNIMNHDKRC